MGVRIITERERRGASCSAATADHLVVEISVGRGAGRNRSRIPIGAPTPANRSRAEREKARLELAYGIETQAAHVATRVPFLFRAMANDYLANVEFDGLASTTTADRRGHLREGNVIDDAFGDASLNTITAEQLWSLVAELQAAGRAIKTIRNYLDSVAAVFDFAADRRGFDGTNPVAVVRSRMGKRRRTKSGRASKDTTLVKPIETLRDLETLVAASRTVAEGFEVARATKRGRARAWTQMQRTSLRDHAALVLMLDAGLRFGEAAGLSWEDANLDARTLRVHRSRPRSGALEQTTKSGRARSVQMSQRLAAVLLEWHLAAGRPAAGSLILDRIDQNNFRKRHWRWSCDRAGLGNRNPKDLRDSFASHLLSSGIPLPYVSKQLGHADVQVTARHYATWVGGDEYVAPPPLSAGMVPADLLATPAAEVAKSEARG